MISARHRSSLLRLARWYGAYLVFSVVALIPLLNALVGPAYTHSTGRQLSYDLVVFNPFTLSIVGYGLTDKNADGSIFWSVSELLINPSPMASIYYGAAGIDELRILGLHVAVAKTGADQFNFTDILTHRARVAATTPKAIEADAFALPRLWIGELELDAQLLHFTDHHRAKPFSSGLRDFHFALSDFSTINDAGDGFALRAQSAQGGVIDWRGNISTRTAKTWGRVSVANFSLLPLWQFMEPQLNFTLAQGQLNLSGQYELSWSDTLTWVWRDALIELNQLAVSQNTGTPLTDGAPLAPSKLQWHKLALDIAQIDTSQRRLHLNSATLDGLSLHSGHRGRQLGLVDMFSLTPTGAPTAGAAAQVGTAPDQDWTVLVERSRLNTGHIVWQVAELDGRVLDISPIELQIDQFNLGEQPSAISAQLQINQRAQVQMRGEFRVAKRAATLDAKITQLPLAWFNPLLDNHLLAHSARGELRVSSRLHFMQAEPTRIDAQVQIDDLLLTSLQGESLARFAQLNVEDLHYDHPQRQLSASALTVKQLDTRLHITPDGTTNLAALLVTPATADAAPQAGATSAGQPLTWQLARIALEDAAIQFTDETPLSTFSTQIQRFNGQVHDVSSAPNTPWRVAFAGQVDGYAPVTLQGWAQPLLADPAMDLSLEFNAMDLAVFNPYATTFTGWQIDKGLLSVALNYQLEQKRITGQNRITLDQLTLGEQTKSQRLVDIPLRLALALLTDRHGIAELDIPVHGTTDDPRFNIGSVIWRAVQNSITKLVTAPFSVLAALIGSQADLGQVDFDPLSPQLGERAQATLAALSTAMRQRPQLRLGISGDVHASHEGNLLKNHQLTADLLASGLTEADIATQSARWRAAALQRLKIAQAASGPSNSELQTQLLAQRAAPATELAALAQARAVAVKQYLVQQLALGPERLFIKAADHCRDQDYCQAARVAFSIEP